MVGRFLSMKVFVAYTPLWQAGGRGVIKFAIVLFSYLGSCGMGGIAPLGAFRFELF